MNRHERRRMAKYMARATDFHGGALLTGEQARQYVDGRYKAGGSTKDAIQSVSHDGSDRAISRCEQAAGRPLTDDEKRTIRESHARVMEEERERARFETMLLHHKIDDSSGVVFDLLRTISYQSATERSRGVPMIIGIFGGRLVTDETVERSLSEEGLMEAIAALPDSVKVGHVERRDIRNMILTGTPAERFNVTRTTAAAWRAHATRGTYEKGPA
jgi:hypothetical protein